jgi:hypothetical protein
MELTDDDIREYQKIWKEEFGEDISADHARRSISEMLELYRMLFLENPPSL